VTTAAGIVLIRRFITRHFEFHGCARHSSVYIFALSETWWRRHFETNMFAKQRRRSPFTNWTWQTVQTWRRGQRVGPGAPCGDAAEQLRM